MGKPTICVDFDGVVHSYEKGWHNGQIYGTIVPGFFEWIEMVKDYYDIVIYSSRSSNPDQKRQMITWLWFRYLEWIGKADLIPDNNEVMPNTEDLKANIDNIKANIDTFYQLITFASEKPPAYLTIDDRAICFKGDWNAPNITLQALKDFKSWTEKGERKSC